MQLTVAKIGAPHGLKGEVRLDVRTDVPERRLAVGTMLETDPQEAGPLTIERTREYKDATYVIFSECRDRTGAEALRLMQRLNPDIVLCVGLAGGRSELCLERVAINVIDALMQ